MFSDRIERESKVAILLSRSCNNVTLLMLYPPSGGLRYIATTFHLKVNKKKMKSVDEILKIKNIKKALNW